jgi:hypothetical protein
MLPLTGESRGYLAVSTTLRLGGNYDSILAPAVRRGGSSVDRVATTAITLGNRCRLAVDFEKGTVWIKWISTHRDYDRIDVKQVKYEK